AHLPVIIGFRAAAVGGLADGDVELARRERDRAGHADAGALGDGLDLAGDAVDLLGVVAGERDAGGVSHVSHLGPRAFSLVARGPPRGRGTLVGRTRANSPDEGCPRRESADAGCSI